jgi:hypothetical protein
MTTANTEPPETEPLEVLVRQWLSGRAHVRELRVIVEAEGVVLEGRAASYYAKQLAQHAAIVVSGLPLRANRIEVRGELS